MKTTTLPNLIILAAGFVFAATLATGVYTNNIGIALSGLASSALFGGIAYSKTANNG
jgi:hypothetical protein